MRYTFLGSYCPPQYKLIDTLFVDSSGFGGASEPALSIPEFINSLEANFAYAVIEAGEFQVYVGKFIKKGGLRNEQKELGR